MICPECGAKRGCICDARRTVIQIAKEIEAALDVVDEARGVRDCPSLSRALRAYDDLVRQRGGSDGRR